MSDRDGGVPSGPLLVLSPHLDDAALSCGALLARPEPVTILDVFTQRPEPEQVTDWDRRCGFRGSDEAMQARWAEEQAAFGDSPHEFLAVDLLDGQYRSGPRDDAEATRLQRSIDLWLQQVNGPVTIAMPVGAGTPRGVSKSFLTRLRARRGGTFAFDNSPDHLFVRDTALAHVGDLPHVHVVLYEDFPYLYAMRGDRLVPPLAAWVGRDVRRQELAVDVGAKARRVAAYGSQLSLLFRTADESALASVLPSVERYWHLIARVPAS